MNRRRLATDYIVLVLASFAWFTFLLSGQPYSAPSPFQNFRNPIHDARPVVSPQPAPAPPHRDRLIYTARRDAP